MTVWLETQERDRLADEASRRRIVETGGPIFGYSTKRDVVVTRVFGPGPGARHRPMSFSLSPAWVKRCINEVFDASAGKEMYIGEWHSHPLGGALPSGADIRAVRSIGAELEVDLARPVVVIQSTKIFRRRIHMGVLAAYRWEPRTGRLIGQTLRVASLAAADHDLST